MIIAGVSKGLAGKVGFSLSKNAIARRCPSCKTLEPSKKRLVSACYVSVVEELEKDGATWVVFMADHGNCSGIEHVL